MLLRLSRLKPPLKSLTLQRRYLETAARDDISKIRNMALVAHIDSGKTTLTESVLLKSSYLSASGSVDTGSTTTDFLPAERERGITIQSASIPVKWKDWTFNLIDTPGHADFGMEVESASRVVDGAVVLIDSVEGVEAQTKGVWRQLDRYGVPTRIMFLNKLDRPGASFKSSLVSLLSHRLHPNPVALTLPISSFDPEDYARAEPGIQGLVDLVNWEIWKWEADETEPTRHPLPRDVDGLSQMEVLPANHPILPHLVPARTALLENLSMFSEELMEQLLELPSGPSSYLTLETPAIMPHLRAASLRKDILPVLCGAAMKNIGTELVMDYVGELLASPLDVKHEVQSADSPLRLLAWKVAWDKKKGWMTYVRVYSGTLKRGAVLWNVTRGQKERISKLVMMYASQPTEVDELPFGSVGVIQGLKFTRTGDTLVMHERGTPVDVLSLREIIPPPAVMSAAVVPLSHSDLDPVQHALESLTRTDPSVRVETQEGQILVHGLGALHLEIVEGRLRDEFEARFEFGQRRVSYREGLGYGTLDDGPNSDKWMTEVSGKPVAVQVKLALRALLDDEPGDPAWDGNTVVDETGTPLRPDTSASDLKPHTYLARGLASALSSSPHTSLAMSRVHIQVQAVGLPRELDASVLAGAAAVVLRAHLRAAGTGPVLEPYIRVKVTVNEDSLGKVVKDLTEHGGEVSALGADAGPDDAYGPYSHEGVYIPPDALSTSSASYNSHGGGGGAPRVRRTVHATAPLSQMLEYNTRLRALSGGHGLFEMAPAGFKTVTDARKAEILKEIGRA
ncbi:hypothetical protein HWV62_42627 [Athelia sp. TMB]|nr:hypothetical protein HWV62_42627 [Athelia sp. TMB]